MSELRTVLPFSSVIFKQFLKRQQETSWLTSLTLSVFLLSIRRVFINSNHRATSRSGKRRTKKHAIKIPPFLKKIYRCISIALCRIAFDMCLCRNACSHPTGANLSAGSFFVQLGINRIILPYRCGERNLANSQLGLYQVLVFSDVWNWLICSKQGRNGPSVGVECRPR